MKFGLGAVITATFAVLSGCSASGGALADSQIARVDAIVRREMAREHIPGLAIGIARNGTMLYSKGFGVRASGKATNAATIFPIGSITKQFTAACVMLLVEQRRVRLDSPIAAYLSHVPHAREVTVRELLDQTSGLADYSVEPGMQRDIGAKKLNEIHPEQLLTLVAKKPLAFWPGTKFAYSNTNYLLAGMVVQSASRTPYQQFLRERILGPLEMHDTQYLRTSIPVGSDVSNGYKIKNGKFVRLPQFTMSWARSAGALASNVHDLVLWDNAFFHGRVVNADLVPTTITPPRVRGEADYAFGWVIDSVRGDKMIWHNGGLPGAHAMNAVFPESGLEIVVLDNLLDSSPEDIAREVYKAVMMP